MGFFSDIGNAFKDAGNWVGDKFEDGAEWVGDKVEDGFHEVKDFAEDTWDDVEGLAGDAWDGVEDNAEEIVTETVPDALQDGAQGIIDGVNVIGDQIDKVPYVGPAVTEWVSNIYEGGEDVVNGMFTGDFRQLGSGAWDMLGNIVTIPKTPISLKMAVQGVDFLADVTKFDQVLNKVTGGTQVSDFLDDAAEHRGFIEMEDGNTVTKDEDGDWPVYEVDDEVLEDGKRRAPVRVLKADDGSVYVIYADGSHEQVATAKRPADGPAGPAAKKSR